MDIEIGIRESERHDIAEGLKHVLADTYTLYLQTHRFHWNVTGPMFQTLHTLFEEQYNELWLATDEIAERIRTLGPKAPGSYKAFSELTSIEDNDRHDKAMAMVATLKDSHEAVCRTIREVLPRAAEARDESTVDMLTQRLVVHEKTAWMLRSLLE